jgi:hypothetical protein
LSIHPFPQLSILSQFAASFYESYYKDSVNKADAAKRHNRLPTGPSMDMLRFGRGSNTFSDGDDDDGPPSTGCEAPNEWRKDDTGEWQCVGAGHSTETVTGSSPDEIVPLPSELASLIKLRAGKGTRCADAIQRLVDLTAKTTGRKKFKQSSKDVSKGLSYVESLFKRVEGKIELDRKLAPFEAHTGSTDFYIGGAKVTMGPATTGHMKEKGLTIDQVNDRYVFTTLHELVHNAAKSGRYTDPDVLRAAISIMKADGHETPEYTTDVYRASNRLNSFFGTYCPNPK